MVPAVSSWHEHYERVVTAIESRLDRGEKLLVPAPGLVEAYSVLTRLPPPFRIAPSSAGALLEANFMSAPAEVAALSASEYEGLIGSAAQQNVSGGAAYDAVIVACALAAKADVLLTFNRRQFEHIAGGRIPIVVP